MRFLAEITITNTRTGTVTTRVKEFGKASYAVWGCHKLGRNKIVDVAIWVDTGDRDRKYDDGWLKVNLNAH